MVSTVAAAPDKAMPPPGKKALATLDFVSPTVNGCLEELTTEVQQLLEWADESQVEAKTWGLDPTLFMAITLRLRNPARPARSLSAASEIASAELMPDLKSAAMVSELVDGAIRAVSCRVLEARTLQLSAK